MFAQYVNGDCITPPALIITLESDAANIAASAKALSEWKIKDLQVAGFIKSRVTYAQSHLYAGETSAAGIWNAICKARERTGTYAMLNHVQHIVNAKLKEGDKPSDHLSTCVITTTLYNSSASNCPRSFVAACSLPRYRRRGNRLS